MKKRWFVLLYLMWVPLGIAMGWWAGFMPFPTRPVAVAYQADASRQVMESGGGEYRIVSAKKANATLAAGPHEAGRWFCENDASQGCHIIEVSERPFYGLGEARWVMTASGVTRGFVPVSLYRTYAACIWHADHLQNRVDQERFQQVRWAIEHQQKLASMETQSFYCESVPN